MDNKKEMIETLKQLKALYDEEILTKEEYEAQKAEVLASSSNGVKAKPQMNIEPEPATIPEADTSFDFGETNNNDNDFGDMWGEPASKEQDSAFDLFSDFDESDSSGPNDGDSLSFGSDQVFGFEDEQEVKEEQKKIEADERTEKKLSKKREKTSRKKENADTQSTKGNRRKRAFLSIIIGSVVILAGGVTAGVLAAKSLSVPIHKAKVGDRITFGHYEQDNDTSNGAEPIKWRVLAKTESELTVISEKGLKAEPYNYDNKVDVTWETCDLRTWVNVDFFSSAFSEEEKAKIQATHRENSSNGAVEENAAGDRVWLLTYGEAAAWLPSAKDRKCKATDYAQANGAYTSDGYCFWWLSDPNDSRFSAYFVDSIGFFKNADVCVWGDHSVTRYEVCVRPALTITI